MMGAGTSRRETQALNLEDGLRPVIYYLEHLLQDQDESQMLGFAVKAGGFRRQSEDGAVRRKHSWCYGGSPEVAKMTMVSMLPSPEGEDKHRPERSSKDAFSVAEVLHRVSGSPDDHAPHPGFHTGPHLGKAGGRAARCEDSCQSPFSWL